MTYMVLLYHMMFVCNHIDVINNVGAHVIVPYNMTVYSRANGALKKP